MHINVVNSIGKTKFIIEIKVRYTIMY